MSHSIRIVSIFSLVGMLLGVALMLVRISNTLDFNEALQLVTSGAEWESMFAVWKVINGQQLYNDRLDIPYNAVVYNWLFYNAYAAFTGVSLHLLALGDEWLPTIGRFFTLVAVASGSSGAYLVFSQLFKNANIWTRIYCFAFAVYLTTGPLIGWWAFTLRADIWAMALEIIAVAVFLRHYRSRPIVTVLMVALICYAAWSFKQINIFAIGATGLFLLLRQDWKSLFILSVATLFLWAATLLIGGAPYREAILFSDFTIVFAMSKGMFNLTSLASKTSPSLVLLGVLGVTFILSSESRRKFIDDDALVLACCGILIALLIAVPASFQTGAADNYYFSLSFFMALAAVAGSAILTRDGSFPKFTGYASIFGWTIHMFAIVLVLGGYQGVTDLRKQHVDHMAGKQCLDKLPRPLFTNDSYYTLPWMTPGNEPFPISFQYLVERAAGKDFKHGGIGGLIGQGYFKALAFIGQTPPPTYDGANLKNYAHRPDQCDTMAVMLKIQD